ncbi:MAG: DUF1499 domain-containing protein [Dinoroseobacter sp.]|nr:DUF1499 domain-containing protein [Dinoroseobacter sp.]
MKTFLSLLAVIAVGLLIYIRLAPSAVERWHVDPTGPAARTGEGRFLVRDGADRDSPIVAQSPQNALKQFSEIALASPRTLLLAGTPETGRMTFISRSKLFGFPDYTTVQSIIADEGTTKLVVYGRLRFGRRDMGVNRARVQSWLKQLTEPSRS